MKTIILFLALLSSSVTATDFKFKFDTDLFKWRPIVKMTTVPYYLQPVIEYTYGYEKIYSLQMGIKYKFASDSYILFKTEYTTDFVPGMKRFTILDNEPILIFEFRTHY